MRSDNLKRHIPSCKGNREVEDLEERFRTLLKGILNNRDELNRLLQEMLRRKLITEDESMKVKLSCKL